ncbi:MAG: hypothetical protein KAX38_02665, partial [Candidatus Krumholzibacteria bacterium]|nr:hypothetical protein [Candidatus Krumholzibacteria bacterium]
IFVLPSLIFWLPNPTPFRHFLVVAVGLASISLFAFSFFKQRAAICLLIITVAGNALVPELLYDTILRHYPFNYPGLSQVTGRIPAQIPLGSPILDQLAHRRLSSYTERELEYISKLNENNIIFMGYNILKLKTHFIKNSEKAEMTGIDEGILKLVCDDKTLYFVTTDCFPQDALFETIIQRMGVEYDEDALWYVNPHMQTRPASSSAILPGLNLIEPFSGLQP